jgi:hypothetical protein
MRAYLEEPEDELKYAVGKLAHAMILEDKDLRDLYAIKPAGLSLATKEGKQWKKEQSLPILKEEDANRVPMMAVAIACHRLASKALEMCPQREVVARGTHRDVHIKGLLDAVGADAKQRPTICEIKTTMDARSFAFAKRVLELDYDMQAAWYMSMLEPAPAFVWIAVESSAPYAVNVFTQTHEMLQSGVQKMEAAITRYKICQDKNSWSTYMFGDYSTEIQQLNPPRWRIEELQGAGMI